MKYFRNNRVNWRQRNTTWASNISWISLQLQAFAKSWRTYNVFITCFHESWIYETRIFSYDIGHLLWSAQIGFSFKGKSPKVPFHEIILFCHTAILKYVIWIFVPIQLKQNMMKKNYQLDRNEKFVDKAHQCLQIKLGPKFKYAVQWSWFLET